MRLRFSMMLSLGAISLAAGGAPPDERNAWAQVQLGLLSQENSACVKDSIPLGLGAGRWFQPRWGYEVTYLHSSLQSKTGLWKANEDHLDAAALYRPLLDTGRWIPFLRAGVGASRLAPPLSLSGSTTTRLNLLLGAGTQVRFDNQHLGTLELRSVTVGSSSKRQELEILVGYGYRWGSRTITHVAAAPPPLPTPVAMAKPLPVMPLPEPTVAPTPPPVVPVLAATPLPAPPPLLVPAPLPTKVVLGDAILHFANNGDQLEPEGGEAIKAVAVQLKAYPGAYTLMVSGHTSSLGGDAHNHALSKRRAEAVGRLLIANGIPADRVFTMGRGPDAPIADNSTREGQSRNRRVEIEIQTAAVVEKVRTETGTVDSSAQRKPPAKSGKPIPRPKP